MELFTSELTRRSFEAVEAHNRDEKVVAKPESHSSHWFIIVSWGATGTIVDFATQPILSEDESRDVRSWLFETAPVSYPAAPIEVV